LAEKEQVEKKSEEVATEETDKLVRRRREDRWGVANIYSTKN